MQQSTRKLQWFLEKLFSLTPSLEIRSCSEISDSLREVYFHNQDDIFIDGAFLPTINVFQYFNKLETPIVTFVQKDGNYYAVRFIAVTTDEVSCLVNSTICVEKQRVISNFASLYFSQII